MTLEDAQAYSTEMKRLADLKAKQEKPKQKLKALSNVKPKAQAKFEWIKTQAEKLGIPPPELPAFGLSAAEKKRKRRGTQEAEEMFKKIELTIEARNDVTEAKRIATTGIEGLAECKAVVSSLRRIQVKDIVKEVEDYLKTYSSARMDIRWILDTSQLSPLRIQPRITINRECG
ncbi:hypothetical protein Tco_0167976 [Tanacetum coccineum]